MSHSDQVLLGLVVAGGFFLVLTLVINALLAFKAEAEEKEDETHGH